MADELYPVVEVPEYEEENEEYDLEYKESVSWDLEKGDFVLNSAGAIKRSDGIDAYKIW